MATWDTMTGAQRAARIKALVGNPNTRVNIPTKYLPEQYRQMRAAAQAKRAAPVVQPNTAPKMNPLFDPMSPLSGDSLRTAVEQLVSAKLTPQLSALDSEQRQLQGNYDARSTRMNDYNQWFQTKASAGATAQGAAQAATGAVDPGYANVANVIAQTAGMRASDDQAMLANQFAQQLADVASRRSAVESTRGGEYADTLNTLRQQEFEKDITLETLLGNQATDAAGLQLDAQKAQEAQAHNATTERISQQNANTSTANAKLAQQKFRQSLQAKPAAASTEARSKAVAEGRGGDLPEMSPSRLAEMQKDLVKVRETAKNLKANNLRIKKLLRSKNGKDRAEGRRILGKMLYEGTPSTNGAEGIPGTQQAYAMIAADVASFGYLSKKTQERLMNLKINPRGLGFKLG